MNGARTGRARQLIPSSTVTSSGRSPPLSPLGNSTVTDPSQSSSRASRVDAPTPIGVDSLAARLLESRMLEKLVGEGEGETVRVDRFVLRQELGSGGMGTVYEAWDEQLQRTVALKFLRQVADDHAAEQRLFREAQGLAQLSHPNVVPVYDVGHHDGRVWIAMEYVPGQTLRAWAHEATRSYAEALACWLELGRGLAAVHEAGLVHRDVKPDNVFLGDDGRVRLLDFGLVTTSVEPTTTGAEAQPAERERLPPPEQLGLLDTLAYDAPTQPKQEADAQTGPDRLDISLTNTGAVLGTPAYMPPEQMTGGRADARSDQYSFCVSLYEAVYGERPFEGHTAPALLMSMLHGDVRSPPKGSRVPPKLRAALLRGLAPRPDDRWPSMEELLAQLQVLVAPRRGRWVALGGGIALGLGLLGAGLAYQADMAQRCSGAEIELEGIWDDARRQGVQTAIVGTELSYAPDTWERVRPRLDRYAEAWVDAHTEVCEATAVRNEQSDEVRDLRLGCLSRRRTALRAAVDVLIDADADVVHNAVKLVADLPHLNRCDDVEWLQEQDQRVPPPEDPQVAQAVRTLRDRQVDIRAMRSAGQYGLALTHAQDVLEQAEALGYGPLHAEAEFLHGSLLSTDGRYAESERALVRAHARALGLGHDAVVLNAAQTLIYVVGMKLSRYTEAMIWAHTAVPLAEHTGRDDERARSQSYLGEVFYGLGEYAQARVHQERALQLKEKALGADHPGVAVSLTRLGNASASQGQYEDAKAHYERALRIREEALGTGHPTLVPVLNNLGNVLDSQGEHAQAKVYYQRSLGLAQEVFGADHPDVAMSLNNLGTLLKSQGELEEAKVHFQRALQILENALGADHPDVAMSLSNLGTVLKGQGEYEQAWVHWERALRIFENMLGADHIAVTYPLIGLAEILLARHDPTAARVYAERALSIREKAGVASEDLAYVRFVLARALWSDRAQRPRARAQAEQARDEFAEHGKGREDDRAEVERWLAEQTEG